MKTFTHSLTPGLSRKHRAWIALYAVQSGRQTLEDILRSNDISEEDLLIYKESWQMMRARRNAVPAVDLVAFG